MSPTYFTTLARTVAVAFTVLLATGGCRRDELPAPRTSGTTMMACKINGVNYVLNRRSIGSLISFHGTPPFPDSTRLPWRWFGMNTHTGNAAVTRDFTFFFKDAAGPGLLRATETTNCLHPTCLLDEIRANYMALVLNRNLANPRVFITGPNEPGELRITYRHHIPAGTDGWVDGVYQFGGTFSFKGREASTGEVVHITEGRFFYNSLQP